MMNNPQNLTEAAFRALEHEMIRFCQESHRGQTYSWDRPYTFHLKMVRDNCLKWLPYLPWSVDPNAAILASWGHDLLEDCPTVTLAILEEKFGPEVANLIFLLTNDAQAPTKEARMSIYHEKIRKDVGAVFIKLCDRISNVEAGGKTDKYRKEHEQFKRELYREGELEPMWAYLESLFGTKEK